MKDPFPFSPPPQFIQDLARPLAAKLNAPTLPLHLHEVAFAIVLYTVVHQVISPPLSAWLCPKTYPHLNKRTKLNWDVHVVSTLQSILVCALSLWLILCDEERGTIGFEQRIWGYTGATGLLTSMACGYFIWDLIMTVMHVNVFGYGMLAHATSATLVFSLGYRPFVNYYAPVFLLYELSSPMVNFHWFLDKLEMTGSNVQLANGILLITTFFSCRLIWGNYNSVLVFHDMWSAYRSGKITTAGQLWPEGKPPGQLTDEHDMFRFTVGRQLPLWLAASYLGANIVLNSLNVYWMGKMIETIRARFEGPFGTKGTSKGRKREVHSFKAEEPVVASGVDMGNEAESKETRSRRRG
ncbi:hypothetical protein KVT40_000714 [Elsinoe batatas]|uniref:TLC domain-containing protein n=1 Tax=Elsinoe batatas TaxID=2601811 RepID=A0A8K0PMY3_9PEZI|nr:hypothetical protein KVT40_000714 [Elsinoe batatas]